MFSKINCLEIIKEHLQTLRSHNTGQVLLWDISLFYVLPLLGILLAIYFAPSEALANVLITSLSVFAALLFNLLLLTLDTIRKQKESDVKDNILLKLLKETYSNIAYATLVALVAICFLMIPYFVQLKDHPRLQVIVWSTIYYLIINFMLTLAMILKRMNVILSNVMKD